MPSLSSYRPLADGVIVEEMPEHEQREGSLYIPSIKDDTRGFSSHQIGKLVTGRVVAVGPGDPVAVLQCSHCGSERRRIACVIYNGEGHPLPLRRGRCERCGRRNATVVGIERLPMLVKPGDLVLYPHRAGGRSIEMGGKTYIWMNEEQFCYGVLEV